MSTGARFEMSEYAAPGGATSGAGFKALIVDWGGVLTSPLATALDGWYAAEGIDAAGYERAIRDFHDEGLAALNVFDPIAALERGELQVEHFEQALAERLTRFCGVPVPAEGLIGRMFAGFSRAPAMVNAVRRAKESGLRTALLSNSWGNDYLRDEWDQLFDAVVISGEVGMRKPEPEIYLHTLGLLDVAPAEAVFVDDLERNVRAAADLGITGVHHRSYAETIGELEALFGVRFAARRAARPALEKQGGR
ncbi:HAD family hydrolase [Actinocrinis puniceicyclus]|nr:HAD family phosphatase [Actinocrinis puniceicyclus]